MVFKQYCQTEFWNPRDTAQQTMFAATATLFS